MPTEPPTTCGRMTALLTNTSVVVPVNWITPSFVTPNALRQQHLSCRATSSEKQRQQKLLRCFSRTQAQRPRSIASYEACGKTTFDRPAPIMSPVDIPCCIKKKSSPHSPPPIGNAPVFRAPDTNRSAGGGVYTVQCGASNGHPFSSLFELPSSFSVRRMDQDGVRLDWHQRCDDPYQTPPLYKAPSGMDCTCLPLCCMVHKYSC